MTVDIAARTPIVAFKCIRGCFFNDAASTEIYRLAGIGALAIYGRIGNQRRAAGSRRDGERLQLIGSARTEPREVHGLKPGVFVNGEIGNGVERRRLIW